MYGDMYREVVIGSGVVLSGLSINGYDDEKPVDVTVYNGGKVVDATVANGWLEVKDGVVSNVKILSGGELEVEHGAAYNVDWTPTVGDVYWDDGATVTFVSKYSGVYLGSDGKLLSHTATMSNKTIDMGGSMYIASGGVASSINIVNNGEILVDSGGYIKDVSCTWSSGDFAGGIEFNPGASGSNIKVYQGFVEADYDTVLTDVYVEEGAWAEVHVASNTRFQGTIHGSSYDINGTFSDKTVSSWELKVDRGGKATNIRISDSGEFGLNEGGYVSGAIIDKGVYYTLTVAPDTYFKGVIDYQWVEIKDGVLSNATIIGGGEIDVSSGGKVQGLKLVGEYDCRDCALEVGAGGVAVDTVLGDKSGWKGCELEVNYGGVASNTTVYNGEVDVECGTLNKITFSSGGLLKIKEGSTVTGLNMVAQGNGIDASLTMAVAKGVTVSGTSNGHKIDMKDGYLKEFYADEYSELIVRNGGVAENTIIKAEYANAEFVIGNGGTAKNTTVFNGTLSVGSGGVASNTVFVDDSYGMSYLKIEGGVHRGTLTLGSGTMVWLEDATIDFSVDERKTTDGYLINNLYRIEMANFDDNVNYTITVNQNQASGTYKLAQEAEDFEATLTIGSKTTRFGNIAVNGTSLIYNGTIYTLKESDGNLTLEIVDKNAPAVPTVKADITAWTNKNVTVTATFAADSVKKEYSVNGGAWQTYSSGVVFTANGNVKFRSTDASQNVSGVATYTVSNIDKAAPTLTISGNATTLAKSVTLKANVSDSASGIKLTQYSLDNKTWKTGSSVTVTENGTVWFKTTDNAGNVTVKSETVDKISKMAPDSNLLKNGVSQIVAWDKEKGAVGFAATDGTPGQKWRGVWDWDGKDAELWRVVGVGHFKGSTVDHDGILLYNGIGTTFAAWTNLNDPSYGYVNLCHVEGNFNTKTLSNLDNNQYDDVLIYDEKGSFGVVLDGATYKDIWHVDDAKTNQWTLRGAGNFGGKEEKLVVENKSGHLYLWTNNDTTFKTWNWSQTAIGYLGDDFEFVATGDFMGDGIDDILVRNTNDGGIWMWDNGDSKTAHWEVTPGKGFKAEAVGDYNGDGKDDLLVREYNTGWGGLGYYAFGGDKLWNDLNARIETDLESKFAVIA